MNNQQYPEHILKQADEMANDAFNAMCDCMNANGATLDFRIIRDTLNLSALLMARERHDLWKEHAAESDKEFLQLEDWLIGNKEIDLKTGLIDRANKCKERIRDLVAAEAELVEVKEQLSQHQQVVKQLVEALEGLKAACLDVLLPTINHAILNGYKMETWTPEQMQYAKAVQDTESALSTAKQLLEKKV